MQLLLSKDKDKFCILKQESIKPLAAWWRSFGYPAALNIKDEYEIQCPAGHLPCPAGQGKAGQGTNSQICIFFLQDRAGQGTGQGRIEKYCPVDTSGTDVTKESAGNLYTVGHQLSRPLVCLLIVPISTCISS